MFYGQLVTVTVTVTVANLHFQLSLYNQIILYDSLFSAMSTPKAILYQHQYGFKRGHSTEQAITQLNNWVLESMDEGKVTGLLFIDISKAFDSLKHKVLLHKLEHLGLSERSLRWFRSYLANRQQSVLINGELSESHTITLGVPQGSILVPLLFNVYINSLPNAVKKTRMILYADDAVLFCDASTRQELQIALEHEFIKISN